MPKKPQEDTLLVAFSVVDGKNFSRKKARKVPNFVNTMLVLEVMELFLRVER